jgi:uncharacterized DUF497 family protein
LDFEWDPEKDRINIARHGISFAKAAAFDWQGAQVFTDDRQDYGEDRFQARGMLGGRLHFVVFTLRGDRVRLISLRKANKRERRDHVTGIGRDRRDP